MIKQTITYDDFNGEEVTEDFYFNLTKLEIMEMEIAHKDGLSSHVEKLTKTENGTEVYHLFKDIILASYGKKSEDGRKFSKKDENGRPYRDELEESPALGELIFGFLKNADASAEFVRGILPSKLLAEVETEMAKRKTEDVELPFEDAPPATTPVAVEPPSITKIGNGAQAERDVESYSRTELLNMPQDQFDKLAGRDPSKMDRALLEVAMQRKSQQ